MKKIYIYIVFLAIFAALAFIGGIAFGLSEFTDKKSPKIISEFGYLERIAYEAAVVQCSKDSSKGVCDRIMIQTAHPYNEEYGAGIYFIFAGGRKSASAGDIPVIQVNMLIDGTVKEVSVEDSIVLDNAPLP